MAEPTRTTSLDTVGDETFSDFWRKNTSNIEAVELANLLRALRKVAGTLGRNVGDIVYAGMSKSPSGSIVLDPDYVIGEYPVPPTKVDYLVGLVVHEALQKTQWSQLVWTGVEKERPGLKPRERIILSKIITLGEEIYVDSISELSILRLYNRQARKVAMDAMRAQLDPEAVSVDELVYLWWLSAWGQDLSGYDLEMYQEPLNVLNSITPELRAVIGSDKGVIDRCNMRRAIYFKAWDGLKDMVVGWRIVDKVIWWSSMEEGTETAPKKGSKPKGVSLSPATALEIEAKLAASTGNITPIIESIVNDPEEEIIPTRLWDYNVPGRGVVDQRQVGRLKAIIQSYADRKILISRGLTSGKVDRKRLYRAPITGECFFDKQSLPDVSWSMCLLIDASGSMSRGQSWKLVESTVATLHKAFRGSTNRLQAWAYFESHGICMITSLLKDNELMSITPGGQTPSGQALIAAAYFLPKDRKRKLIIHITDGASNSGCHVQYGMDFCRQQGVQLITLGCGLEDEQAMSEQYGRSVQFLDNFGQLPNAIEKLLKWAFLYGIRETKSLLTVDVGRTGEPSEPTEPS
ncbi:MAG: vWA domain-containing protein [Chloroflexota bacterium]|nr:vWA domain-containing protein [Chloroflexota bacterium]